jgi:hypothetical protein
MSCLFILYVHVHLMYLCLELVLYFIPVMRICILPECKQSKLMLLIKLDRQYGVRESKDVTVEGRVQFDLLQVVSYIYMTTKPVDTFV